MTQRGFPIRTFGNTLAAALSLARLPLAVAFPLAAGPTRAGIIIVAGLTDLFDGFAARHLGKPTW